MEINYTKTAPNKNNMESGVSLTKKKDKHFRALDGKLKHQGSCKSNRKDQNRCSELPEISSSLWSEEMSGLPSRNDANINTVLTKSCLDRATSSHACVSL